MCASFIILFVHIFHCVYFIMIIYFLKRVKVKELQKKIIEEQFGSERIGGKETSLITSNEHEVGTRVVR